jgi:signal transduction histidine kinase
LSATKKTQKKSLTIQVKFALYNAVSKALIILAFMTLLPLLVEKIVYEHIDKRLVARSERILLTVKRGSIADIVREQDCSFESYNILKEEFVAIYPITDPLKMNQETDIRNETWRIEGEKLQHRIIRRPFLYDNQMYELNIGEGISTIEELKIIIQRFLLVMMLGVILISLFIDIAFARILLRPLNNIISKKLLPVPSPSSFDFTAIPSSTSEFNQLDDRINEMMHKLKDTFQIEKEFISNVSHELQTPISIIQNRIENIINEENLSDELLIKLSDSQRTLNRMSRIIKALLLISKIENDQYLKQDKVSAIELMDEVLEEIEERLSKKDITLHKHFYEDYTIQNCNRTLLFTMMTNLVNNAIKYNKDGGTIDIYTRYKDGQFQIEVKDSGIGIEKNEIEGIFDRFTRLNKGKADGYGLGLPLVKTIAGFHNIEIIVESTPDVGTEFVLRF